MIICGWCGRPAEGRCEHCRRAASLPWVQRAQEPPQVGEEADVGRPRLDRSQVRQRLRIAHKELGPDATNADLAEHLGISERQLGRWQKLID